MWVGHFVMKRQFRTLPIFYFFFKGGFLLGRGWWVSTTRRSSLPIFGFDGGRRARRILSLSCLCHTTTIQEGSWGTRVPQRWRRHWKYLTIYWIGSPGEMHHQPNSLDSVEGDALPFDSVPIRFEDYFIVWNQGSLLGSKLIWFDLSGIFDLLINDGLCRKAFNRDCTSVFTLSLTYHHIPAVAMWIIFIVTRFDGTTHEGYEWS